MSSSTLIFGQPFAAPIKHTVLPVIERVIGRQVGVLPPPASARIVGYLPIAETEFTGTETTFTVQAGAGGAVNVSSLRLPTKVQDGSGLHQVQEYMVAYYDQPESSGQPWLGYPSFIGTDDTGYYSWWSLPTITRFHHYGRGVLFGSLWSRMNIYPAPASTNPPTPPGENGTLRWAASMNLASAGNECAFFDFNWMELFQSNPPPGTMPGQLTPLAIMVTAQPEDGEFKAAVLQRETVLPGGGVVYNTVRIIRMLDNVVAQDYEFTFQISQVDTEGRMGTTDVTLTLTVV
jgi:hypothetical protein